MKTDIKSLTLPELKAAFAQYNYPGFRAKQVFDWLHKKRVSDFTEMQNIPIQMQKELVENFCIISLKIIKKLVSSMDHTVKYLYMLPDGEYIESVWMKYRYGNSLCISTEVGCKMGCTFCASTKQGFVRQLSPSEILEQIYMAEKDMGEKVSSIVLMGIGEPLDNFENVLQFFTLLSCPEGLNMSLRHVTVSTCGVVDKIYELAEKNLQLTLSISLHAPNDEIRSQTMPVNRKWNIEELLKACRYYTHKTSRRISFEYALIRGVNDSRKNAEELAGRLKGMLCHVNLIPVNQIRESNYRARTRANVYRFQEYLNQFGIQTTVRRTLGADIQAACGQLRRDQYKQ